MIIYRLLFNNIYESVFYLVVLFVVLLVLVIGTLDGFAAVFGLSLLRIDLLLQNIKTKQPVDLFEHLLSLIVQNLILHLGKHLPALLLLLVYHVTDDLLGTSPRKLAQIHLQRNH